MTNPKNPHPGPLPKGEGERKRSKPHGSEGTTESLGRRETHAAVRVGGHGRRGARALVGEIHETNEARLRRVARVFVSLGVSFRLKRLMKTSENRGWEESL